MENPHIKFATNKFTYVATAEKHEEHMCVAPEWTKLQNDSIRQPGLFNFTFTLTTDMITNRGVFQEGLYHAE